MRSKKYSEPIRWLIFITLLALLWLVVSSILNIPAVKDAVQLIPFKVLRPQLYTPRVPAVEPNLDLPKIPVNPGYSHSRAS